MKIISLFEPFFHNIIHDFYDSEEQSLIWEELEFLNKPGKLLPPDETGDPLSSPNKKAVFLDSLYSHRQFSNILSLNRKIFKILPYLKDNPFSEYIRVSDTDHTMVSYYEDGSYYKSHHDYYVISTTTTFWKEPKKFTGGELKFTEFDYTPEMFHNSIIIFPSYLKHEVTPLKLDDNDGVNGRYSINQFFSIRQSML